MIISAKFQVPNVNRVREIARTHRQTHRQTDRPTEKIRKLNNPIFGLSKQWVEGCNRNTLTYSSRPKFQVMPCKNNNLIAVYYYVKCEFSTYL